MITLTIIWYNAAKCKREIAKTSCIERTSTREAVSREGSRGNLPKRERTEDTYIELGFADGLLNERHEENAPASALFFSRRAADRALVNKIVSQIPVQPLYDRLERLKSETAG